MPRDAIETLEVEGLTVTLYPDSDPQNPRDDDNLGIMVAWHSRYNLGDAGQGWAERTREGRKGYPKWPDPSSFMGWLKQCETGLDEDGEPDPVADEDKPRCLLPLGLYDHSGITMYVGSRHPFDQQGWDSGQVGYIYTTNARLKEMGHADPESLSDEEVEGWLRGEVETYDQYLTGDVWGYTITDSTGEEVDSCWGFYGLDYCRGEATSAAEHHAKGVEAERLREMEERDGA